MMWLLWLLIADVDLASLRQRCGAGDDEACMPLWDAANSPEANAAHSAWKRNEKDPESACLEGSGPACATDPKADRRHLRLACAQRYWFACNNLEGAGDKLGRRVLIRMSVEDCQRGYAGACRTAADWMSLTVPAEERWAKQAPLYEKACNAGDGPACYTLAGRAEGPASLRLLERGCELRNPDACYEAGMQQKSPAAKRRMWRFACDHGVRDACVKK
jgi:hypothetical protein